MSDSTTSNKTSVLFCCLGNICRSTMAEGVFRSLTSTNPNVGTIDSCGTAAYHSLDPPDYRTLATLRAHNITDYDHGARQIRPQDFDEFDYIFAMDASNLGDLLEVQRRVESKSRGKKARAKVMLFGEFAGPKGKGKAEEVEDPYYGGDGGFDAVYEQVVRFSENFLREVVNRGDAGGAEKEA